MDIKSIISNKRLKYELQPEEIKIFIGKLTRNDITDAQAAALLSYIYINGLTEKEILNMATEMANSGDTLSLSEISSDIVDVYSTGGVGDKISLLLIPIISALGVPIAKVSSTDGFGISSGIIDRLESIPGFDAEISLEDFKENIKNIGASVINQNMNIVPAEKKIYKLRNEIACGGSIPIIVASLMSLNIATGSKNVIFNITYGKGNYIKDKEDARSVAKLLKKLGAKLKKNVGCIIMSADEPLGYSVGHILEIKEVIECMQGRMLKDVQDVIFANCKVILDMTLKPKGKAQHEKMVMEAIDQGKVLSKFKEIVEAHHGSLEYIDDIEKFLVAKNVIPVYATEDGLIKSIDSDMVWSIARYLGAGRMNEEDISRTAGIQIKKKIGDEVKIGDVLAFIHTNDESKVLGATQNLKDAFEVVEAKNVLNKKTIEIV